MHSSMHTTPSNPCSTSDRDLLQHHTLYTNLSQIPPLPLESTDGSPPKDTTAHNTSAAHQHHSSKLMQEDSMDVHGHQMRLEHHHRKSYVHLTVTEFDFEEKRNHMRKMKKNRYRRKRIHKKKKEEL
ncbi:hypothetical protein RYX36_016016 [Vicia faba]